MSYFLVADVGGTNTRLGRCLSTGDVIESISYYKNSEFTSLEDIIASYLKASENQFDAACIAVACPAEDDLIVLTNISWSFSKKELQKRFGFKHLHVINDFAAVSMSIPVLEDEHLIKLGGGEPQKGAPKAIFGPGTGLGVSHILEVSDRWLCLPGEGGHVDFAAGSAIEAELFLYLHKKIGHVSAERVLSGLGLQNIYGFICHQMDIKNDKLLAHDITARAIQGNHECCSSTVDLFCTILGRFAGNLAINLGCRGGVYIAGGILPKIEDLFKKSNFRAAFEDKGRFRGYLEPIPVYLIKHRDTGLLGAWAELRQYYGYRL